MSDRTAARLAWSLAAVAFALTAVAFALLFMSLGSPKPPWLFGFRGFTELLAIVFATTGAVVASRQPRNAIGWLLLAMGIASTIQGISTYVGIYELGEGGNRSLASWGIWVTAWSWIPLTGCLALIFLIFPNGQLVSRRWRWALAAAVAGIGISTVANALPNPMTGFGGLPNPVYRGSAMTTDFADATLMLYLLAHTLGTLSLFVRFRRSETEARQQLKWLALAASAVTVCFSIYGVAVGIGGESALDSYGWLQTLTVLAFLGVPVAIGFAILKYRLYDIDLVINRAVVYGALAVFITIVYVAVVVGVGAAIGTQSNAVLSAVAAAIVALAFQPARRRAQRFANRLVYGKRATPYEVLSELSSRFAGTYSLDDALPRLARVTAEAVGAERAYVWLRGGGELRPAAGWPDGGPSDAVVMAGDELPGFGEGEVGFPVRHQGELLGAITVGMPATEPLGPVQEKLLDDVAAHAGLVLRNVALLEDLRASRKRIVAAQDDRARALERNIHDGAQQQLVALTVKLRLAQSLMSKDPAKAGTMLADLQAETQAALENLRDLARGIYPPLLADKGLHAALEAQARKAALPVRIESDGVGRYAQDIEAAVYFCALEALQNVAKYAQASTISIRLAQRDGRLEFEIEDDGVGFETDTTPRGSGLQNMADRLDAIGGRLSMESAPGRGTRILGAVAVGEAVQA